MIRKWRGLCPVAEKAIFENRESNQAIVRAVNENFGLVGQALTEIEDISRGMREKIVDEKNPSYKDAERGGKEMPSEREMKEAVERARDANSKEKCRQAEQQSDWRLLMS